MTGDYPIGMVLDILNIAYPYHPMGNVTDRDPYKVLICCLLSIRSRDVVTMPACTRLFLVADTPQKMLELSREQLKVLIAPVQFYRNKVDIIRHVSQELIDRFQGSVPETIEELETMKGVGRKTANLVLGLGFNKPSVSVDTHVHRICNRLGYVRTKSPEETEQDLRKKLPQRYWLIINRVMVRHGQEICVAGKPACDICPVNEYCMKVSVTPRASRLPQKAVHPIFLEKANIKNT